MYAVGHDRWAESFESAIGQQQQQAGNDVGTISVNIQSIC